MLGALLVALACSTPGQAAILQPTISFNGVADEYKDNSRALVADENNNGVVNTGDIVYGLLRVGEKILPVSEGYQFPITDQLIAVFSFQVTAVNGLNFQHGPVPHTNPHSLYGIGADPDFRALLSTSDWDNSVFAFLERPNTSDPTLNPNPGDLVLASILGDDGSAGTISGWSVDLIGGKVAQTDFMESRFGTASIAVLLATTAPTPLGQIVGGLSAQYNNIGASAFLQVPITHLDLVTNSTAQLTFSANVLGYDQMNWLTQDNANIRFNAVPEPSTVVLLCLGAATMLAALRRR